MPEAKRLARCKPLLGTLVEMSCVRTPSASLQMFDEAFAAVTRVHHLMSFQMPDSGLNSLNRARLFSWIEVDPELGLVLTESQRLASESDHIFNPCFRSGHAAASAYQVKDGRARRLVGCEIDLSGIAKGYAVDRATALLMAQGAKDILVNAGGDMRHCGEQSQAVLLRDPTNPTRHQGSTFLCNAALASSVSHRLDGDGLQSAATVCDGRDGRPMGQVQGATVIAPRAMLADVLAKVLLVEPMAGATLCDRYGARGISFEPPVFA